MAIQVNAQSFAQEVEQAAGAVLIDFYADWCAPCRMVAPILDEVAKERPDVKVVKVNIDDTPELAQRFGVMSIPTLISVIITNQNRVTATALKEQVVVVIGLVLAYLFLVPRGENISAVTNRLLGEQPS